MNKSAEVKKLVDTKLTEIFDFIGVKPKINVWDGEEDIINVDIEGNDLNFLIGYRGESLDALQTLTGLIAYKQLGEWATLVIDINGYKKQKQEKIEQIARTYIDKARFLGKEIEMNPMSPAERRWVHSFVSTYDDVISESTGEGMDRRVVIKPKR